MSDSGATNSQYFTNDLAGCIHALPLAATVEVGIGRDGSGDTFCWLAIRSRGDQGKLAQRIAASAGAIAVPIDDLPMERAYKQWARPINWVVRRMQEADTTEIDALARWSIHSAPDDPWTARFRMQRLPGWLAQRMALFTLPRQSVMSGRLTQSSAQSWSTQPSQLPNLLINVRVGADTHRQAIGIGGQITSATQGWAAIAIRWGTSIDWIMGILSWIAAGACAYFLPHMIWLTVLLAVLGFGWLIARPKRYLNDRFAHRVAKQHNYLRLIRLLLLHPMARSSTKQIPEDPLIKVWNIAGSSCLWGTASQLMAVLVAGTSQPSGPNDLNRASKPLVSLDGPRFGRTPDVHEGLHMQESERFAGVLCSGVPGCGKTSVLMSLLADSIQHNVDRPNKFVWIETKGQGVQHVAELARLWGVPLDIVWANDPHGSKLGLVDLARPISSAGMLTSALKYALEPGDIHFQSFDVIQTVLAALLCADESELSAQFRDTHLMKLAQILMGGLGDAAQRVLLADLRAQTGVHIEELSEPLSDERPADRNLAIALKRWDYYMGQSERTRQDIMRPPLNKLEVLGQAQALWDKAPDITIQSWLRGDRSLVVVVPPDMSGSLARWVASLLLYVIWSQVRYTCIDWGAQKKSLDIYCDELASILGSGNAEVESVIAQMYDHGREYGVRLALATQRLEQLRQVPADMALVKSFGNQFVFAQSSAEVADTMMQQLFGVHYDQQGATTEDIIRSLETHRGIARLRIDGKPSAPCAFETIPINELIADARQLRHNETLEVV